MEGNNLIINILFSLLITVIWIGGIIYFIRFAPPIYDYKFSKTGIDVFVFGAITVWHIDIKRIKDVQIITPWEAILRTQMGLNLVNRMSLKEKCIVVKVKGFPWVITLTPEDPEAALRALNLKRDRMNHQD